MRASEGDCALSRKIAVGGGARFGGPEASVSVGEAETDAQRWLPGACFFMRAAPTTGGLGPTGLRRFQRGAQRMRCGAHTLEGVIDLVGVNTFAIQRECFDIQANGAQFHRNIAGLLGHRVAQAQGVCGHAQQFAEFFAVLRRNEGQEGAERGQQELQLHNQSLHDYAFL
jgi:hypothetical protein